MNSLSLGTIKVEFRRWKGCRALDFVTNGKRNLAKIRITEKHNLSEIQGYQPFYNQTRCIFCQKALIKKIRISPTYRSRGYVFNDRQFEINSSNLDYWFVSFLRHMLSVGLCQNLSSPKQMWFLVGMKGK